MAAAGASQQCQPFDVDVLYAKLETVKRQQDAERSRRRRHHLSDLTTNMLRKEPAQKPLLARTEDEKANGKHRARLAKSSKAGYPTGHEGVHPQQLFDALTAVVSKDDRMRSQTPLFARSRNRQRSRLSGFSSTDDLCTKQAERFEQAAKSKSAVDLNDLVTPRQRQKHSAETADEGDPPGIKKRRAKTFPWKLSTFSSWSQCPETVYQYNQYTESAMNPTICDESMETPTDFMNEFTVSYDCSQLSKHDSGYESDRKPEQQQYFQSQKFGRPQWMRSGSMLNLPSFLKKDQVRHEGDEVGAGRDEDEYPIVPTSHKRIRSLPIDLHKPSDAQTRTGERASKRSTLLGFFKMLRPESMAAEPIL